MRMPILLTAFLTLPAVALAADDCKHAAPRQLALDLSGISTVQFNVGSSKLRLNAIVGKSGSLSGRACATSEDLLNTLTLTQQRSGNTLVVTLQRKKQEEQNWQWLSFGNYAYLELSGSVPDNIPLQVNVGSGEIWVTGAAELTANIGSSDAQIQHIKGKTSLVVGSGDVDLQDIGVLTLSSLGSGSVKASQIRGDVEIGSIGSGEVELNKLGKSLKIGSIGSGSAEVANVQGNVSIGTIGSGTLDSKDVTGSVTVSTIGSGSLDVRRIGGDLRVSNKGSGSIRRADVQGTVQVPERY